jgi:hypothetical protein
MKSRVVLMILAVVFVFSGRTSSQDNRMTKTMMKPDQASVERIISGWRAKPQETARKLIAKYGAPNEATSMRLVWVNNGPWKMTELVNEEVPHNFPKPHPDYLKQTINYRVPPDKFDELAEYDGSVIVERTKGEIAARCDMEGANILALNLAHEIVTGKRSVKEARKFYAETVREMKNPEYMQSFMFTADRVGKPDVDMELVTNGSQTSRN